MAQIVTVNDFKVDRYFELSPSSLLDPGIESSYEPT